MPTPPANPPQPEPQLEASPYGPLPAYSASERPATRMDRIAFQVWIVFFLLILVFAMINYLLTWIV